MQSDAGVGRFRSELVGLRRIFAHVVDQILKLIQTETLKTGNQLPSQTFLATHFGVSRSSVREALTALQALGFLSPRQALAAS